MKYEGPSEVLAILSRMLLAKLPEVRLNCGACQKRREALNKMMGCKKENNMALNTESTTGLLGGHTWKYGTKSGVASISIVTALATFATSFSGDHLSIRKYSFDIGDYIEEKFVFCDGATYTGATGDIVNVGEAVGNSVNSAIQGIAVKFTVGAAAEAIHTQIGLALSLLNVQIDLM